MALHAREPVKRWLLRKEARGYPVLAHPEGEGVFHVENVWGEPVVVVPFFSFAPREGGDLLYAAYDARVFRWREGGGLEPAPPLEERVLFSDGELTLGVRVYRLGDVEGGAALAVHFGIFREEGRLFAEVGAYCWDGSRVSAAGELKAAAARMVEELCPPLAHNVWLNWRPQPFFTEAGAWNLFRESCGLLLKPGERALLIPQSPFMHRSSTIYTFFVKKQKEEGGAPRWYRATLESVVLNPLSYFVAKLIDWREEGPSLWPAVWWRVGSGGLPEELKETIFVELKKGLDAYFIGSAGAPGQWRREAWRRAVENLRREVEALEEKVRAGQRLD